jgi:flagellar hook-associated protein 2
MSTSSVSSSTASSSTSGYQLTSQGSGTPLQITGLASGLDTNAIVTELMSIYQQPVTALQNTVSGLTAENTQLSSIQTALQTLSTDAAALLDPTLFQNSQAVTSSDPTRVAVSGTTSGAGVGGYQVSVTQLANSAQRTFTYAAPASGSDTVTIDGQQVSVASGETAQDFAASVNGNNNMDVWAAATSSGTVVFSSRSTGLQTGSYIQVSDTGSSLTEQTSLAYAGQNASYSVNGGATQTASSNTITSAIPGVTLNLTGVTTTSGPVTVNVAPPAPDSTNIQTAVNTFITQYNSVLSTIQTQMAQQPSSSDPTQGTLYDDSELQGLLSSMRSLMYSPGAGLPTGMATMMDIGVSTGATTGSGAVSASAVAGNLTLDATTLTNALTSNPSGVQQVLETWANSFETLVNNEADPGGSMDLRIQGDSSQISDLNNQIANMQSALTDRQTQLTNEFAQMEAALSQNQSTSSWLTQQIAALP